MGRGWGFWALRGARARGAPALGGAAVVEGEGQSHAVVVLGELDGLADLSLEPGVEAVQVADVEEPDAVLVEVVGLTLDDTREDGHEAADLPFGAAPVLGGEGGGGGGADAVGR